MLTKNRPRKITEFLPASLPSDFVPIPSQVREALELLGQLQSFAKADLLNDKEIENFAFIAEMYSDKIKV